jgi:preprotein translocase subunit YajC
MALNYTLLAILAVLLAGTFLLTQRNRKRLATQQAKLRQTIGFGTEVMTTSGLYGTVVGMNDDDTVRLAIAPGVEVKWAVAALRDQSTLPDRYRQGLTRPDDEPHADDD